MSKIVDIDLFLSKDVQVELSEGLELIAKRQTKFNTQILAQPDSDKLVAMIESFNEEAEFLQETLSATIFKLAAVVNEKEELEKKYETQEKLIIDLKREIEQYLGGQRGRRYNEVDIDALHTK
uniref:Uncharacterized protein n=1 Tax=Euplotes harpa TaxID=151035 RepID=A0A7S3NAD6_9SPIT|mmetsp:Transcript_29863/g.34222  ORF Transcript_29863/g.34222 Transcript_29863/m.34222 type:complete len:123 (+) Transcript_29863:237-605(+)